MQDTIITFKGKAHTDSDGNRYVSLVSPKPHHINADRMVTPKAIEHVWGILYGPNGSVKENDPLVTSFGTGFMPIVTVNIGNVRSVSQWKSKEFWPMVSAFREKGQGMLRAEQAAHKALLKAAMASRN